jgi:hypothetical protein
VPKNDGSTLRSSRRPCRRESAALFLSLENTDCDVTEGIPSIRASLWVHMPLGSMFRNDFRKCQQKQDHEYTDRQKPNGESEHDFRV